MEYLSQPLLCISGKCSTFTFTFTYFGISKTNIHFTYPICLLKFYIYPHPIGIVKWILPPNTGINNLFGTIVQAFGRILLSFFYHFLIKNKSGKGWCITCPYYWNGVQKSLLIECHNCTYMPFLAHVNKCRKLKLMVPI